MSYTVKTTEPDPEFLNAGKKNGILVWRIENFKVKKVKAEDCGKFYTGDSYIVLNTNLEKNLSNIHYWLGSESSIDEYGTCALKAIELDDYLGGKPVQYREVQYYESSQFLALFEEKGLRYLCGGCPSGFKDSKAEAEQKSPKLYMVKGKKDIRIVEVPLKIESLNKSDVFILDDNKTVFQWNGPGANRTEKLRGGIFSKRIRDDDHNGKVNLVNIESEDWDKCEDFWRLLPGDKEAIKNESDVADVDFERSFNSKQISLYKVSDEKSSEASIELVHNGKLSRNMLDSKDCFILDCNSKGIYCWIGRNCTTKEKISTVNGSKSLMMNQNYPNYIPLETVIDGGESIAFKSLFYDWNNQI